MFLVIAIGEGLDPTFFLCNFLTLFNFWLLQVEKKLLDGGFIEVFDANVEGKVVDFSVNDCLHSQPTTQSPLRLCRLLSVYALFNPTQVKKRPIFKQ
jgi:hypothetical protein